MIFLIPVLIGISCNRQDPAGNYGLSFIVSMENPENHYFEVEMSCTGMNQDTIDFRLPAWTPGYYMILNLAQHIVDFSARDEHGNLLKTEKTDKNCWSVISAGNEIINLHYFVFANRRSVAEPYLDSLKGFLSPTGVFMYIDDHLDNPVDVTIVPPDSWEKVSTGLTETSSDLSELFDIYIPTTAEIDYQKYLSYAGLQIDLSPVGEEKVVLNKTFKKKTFSISKLLETTELQDEIYQSWIKQ